MIGGFGFFAPRLDGFLTAEQMNRQPARLRTVRYWEERGSGRGVSGGGHRSPSPGGGTAATAAGRYPRLVPRSGGRANAPGRHVAGRRPDNRWNLNVSILGLLADELAVHRSQDPAVALAQPRVGPGRLDNANGWRIGGLGRPVPQQARE